MRLPDPLSAWAEAANQSRGFPALEQFRVTVIERSHGTGSQASYSLDCRACQHITAVVGDARHFDCGNCGCRSFFLACERCHGANLVLGNGRGEPIQWRCDWCLVQNANSAIKRLKREPASAADAWAALDRHALTYGDRDVAMLGGFELVGGHGDCPPPGTLCSVGALADGVLIVAELGATGRVMLPYRDLLAVEVGGRGIIERSAGLVGGGVGMRGTLKGIAMAHVINNLTRKTEVDSFLRITAAETEMLFSHWRLGPAQVRSSLGRLFTAQMAAARQNASQPVRVEVPTSPAAPPPRPPSAIDELERLTKLHAAGTLTDTEFEIARAQQIRRLHAGE